MEELLLHAEVFELQRPDGSQPCAICVKRGHKPPGKGDVLCDSCNVLCCVDHSYNVRRQSDNYILDCLCRGCMLKRASSGDFYPVLVKFVRRSLPGEQASNP